MSRHKGSCKAWNALSVEEKKILHKAHTNIPKDADKEPDKEPDNTTAEEDVGGDPLLDNFVDRQGAGVHEARGNDGAADGSESESDGDENNGAAGSKRGTPRPLTRRELSAAKRSALVNGQMSPRTKATAVKQKTFGFGDAVDYLINAQNWNTCDNYFNDAAARTSKRIIIWSHPLHPAVVAKRLIWPCLLHPAVVGLDFSFAYTLLHRSLSLSLPLTMSICCCLCSCLSASLCVSGVLRLCISASLTLSALLSLSPSLSRPAHDTRYKARLWPHQQRHESIPRRTVGGWPLEKVLEPDTILRCQRSTKREACNEKCQAAEKLSNWWQCRRGKRVFFRFCVALCSGCYCGRQQWGCVGGWVRGTEQICYP